MCNKSVPLALIFANIVSGWNAGIILGTRRAGQSDCSFLQAVALVDISSQGGIKYIEHPVNSLFKDLPKSNAKHHAKSSTYNSTAVFDLVQEYDAWNYIRSVDVVAIIRSVAVD